MALDTRGIVLRIERSSIHDGPGLRTVLYLKGCSLSCSWCSTPESQSQQKQLGHDHAACHLCGQCVSDCPSQALTIHEKKIIRNLELCTDCLTCVEHCPHSAHKAYGSIMSVSEVVEEISKDEIFFFHSGGGITISGGECFTQPHFTAAVLQECCRRGIDTAVESALCVTWEAIEPSLPFLNTIYIDLKHFDSKQHQKLTGSGNELILNNLQKLDDSEHAFALSIRIPLIPGVNDDDINLSAILHHASSLKKVSEVELLAYHRLGISTYDHLNRRYLLRDCPAPSEAYLNERFNFLKRQDHAVALKLGSGYH